MKMLSFDPNKTLEVQSQKSIDVKNEDFVEDEK